MLAVFILIGSYLLGSFPSAYFAGKLSGGKGVTRSGTGNTGASSVWDTKSRSWGFAVFLADALKGAIPPFACRLLDLGLPLEVACGVAAVAGHNWSVFLKFRGGRGISSIIGVLFILAPVELGIALAISLIGIPLRNFPLFNLVSLAVLPFLGAHLSMGEAIVTGETAIALLAIAKRLEANGRRIAPTRKTWLVLLYRFLYDRDIKDRKDWKDGREQL